MLNKKALPKQQAGAGIPELLIVIFVIAILIVLALPRIITSRSISQFADVKKQFIASVLNAQKEAMSVGAPITFRYDDTNKKVVIYGGRFGGLSDFRNQVIEMDDKAISSGRVIYGRPPGAKVTPLMDGSNITPVTEDGVVEIQFQPNGSITDENNAQQDKALFLYNSKNPKETAFAISIKGSGEQIKIWRFSPAVNDYME
jgi:type II secretory pathway pseudopilin PulG